jgi:hypothetical protein
VENPWCWKSIDLTCRLCAASAVQGVKVSCLLWSQGLSLENSLKVRTQLTHPPDHSTNLTSPQFVSQVHKESCPLSENPFYDSPTIQNRLRIKRSTVESFFYLLLLTTWSDCPFLFVLHLKSGQKRPQPKRPNSWVSYSFLLTDQLILSFFSFWTNGKLEIKPVWNYSLGWIELERERCFNGLPLW